MFFGLSFGIAFYMGYVWNVYEVGMVYALILHELCQEIVGGNHGNTQGKPKGNLRGAIGKLWGNVCVRVRA